MNRKPLVALIASLLLLAAAPGAQAASDPTQRVSTGVGRWIAAQGNAALRDITEDMRRELERDLRPLVPAPEGFGPNPAGNPSPVAGEPSPVG